MGRDRPPLRTDDPADRALLDAVAAQYASLETLSVPLWVFSLDRFQVLWANRAGRRLWEAPSMEELQGRDLDNDLTDATRHSIYVIRARLGGGESVTEMATLTPRGVPKRVRLNHHPIVLADGSPAMMSEAEIEPSAELLVEFAAQATFLLVLFDEAGHLLSMNAAARTLLHDRVCSLADLVRDATPLSDLVRSLAPVEPRGHDVEIETARGACIFRVELRRIAGPDGVPRVLASLFDVSTQRRERAELVRLAHTDALTGLANRHGVLLEARRRFARTEAFDVLYLDLDDLKQLNDGLGHRFGDLALNAAARRIASALPESGFAGRMGGDEFVAFVPGDGLAVAERIRAFLSMPYDLDGVRLLLTASVGVAAAADAPLEHDADSIEERIRRADAAMLEAKRSGRNRVQRALAGSLANERRIRQINGLLQDAVRNGELRIVVQPIVRLSDGRTVRGECLVRWQCPTLGSVPPTDFIPVAEQSGMIREIGRVVLAGAADLLRELHAEGLAVPLAVNLSAREAVLPTLADDIRAELTRTGIPPSLLAVELTESAMVGRWDLARAGLEEVRRLGVSVSLDDFGTGYSALAVMHQLAVDTIKIDRSLVLDLPDARAMAVARAILRLAESLDVTVVAEGVETAAQSDALRELGCGYGQGWRYAQPLEVAEFMARLREQGPDS